MRKAVILGAIGVIAVGATAAWRIQHDITADQAGLLARAAISAEQARQTALAAVPGGTITESEIEEENGRLIYSFDIEVAGRGSFDVEVDAMTGALLQSEAEEEDDEDEDEDEDEDDRESVRR